MPPDSQLSFQRGDVISRKYEIEEPLGTGTFGATYLARHITSNRHVVIKFIWPKLVSTPAARERLQEGFARAKNLRHPNLVKYGELNEHDGLVYVTEEYFQAETLRQVIQHHISSSEPFTLQDACQIVIKVLEALEVGHESGIFHRDIKPENVLVRTQRSGPGGSRIVRTVKVTDLGIADIVDGTLLGDRFDSGYDSTYMAPELVHFGQDGTPQADIYSVGVILYELLCGQVPRGTFFSPTQVRDDLPEHVDQIVELALSPDSSDRYPSPKDMILDIQRSFNIDNQSGGGSGKGFRTMLIGLALAVLGVVGIGVYFGIFGQENPIEAAKRQDEIWRKQVQIENTLPDEATIRAMQEKHPEMNYVPAGPYLMGRLNVEAGVAPMSEPSGKKMNVTAFYIDRFEFPNRPGELPAGKVSYADAEDACKKLNKRLCRAEEWEKACKGFPNFIYSYGDTYDPSMCGGGMESAYKLGERRDCVSPYGVYDMSGGFREWTSTSPPGKETRKFVKGGLRGSDEMGSRCAFAVDEDIQYSESTLTFRCCADVTE